MSQELDHSKFADYVIKRWLTKIKSLGIGKSNELYNSFVAEVTRNANGDVNKMIFTFRYYGRFVEMGVGKGISLADIGVGSRAPKPWYSKIFVSQVKKLAELMGKDLAYKSTQTIVEILSDTK